MEQITNKENDISLGREVHKLPFRMRRKLVVIGTICVTLIPCYDAAKPGLKTNLNPAEQFPVRAQGQFKYARKTRF